MKIQYPEYIQRAAKAAFNTLQEEFPALKNIDYDSNGFPVVDGKGGYSFQHRMELGIYIELIKSGLLK